MSLCSTEVWMAILGLVGYLTLVAVLFVKRRSGTFWCFTLLILFEIIEVVTLYFVHKRSNAIAYGYTYWSLEIVESVIRIGVMIELARITGLLAQMKKQQYYVRCILQSLVIATLVTLGVFVFHRGPYNAFDSFAFKTSTCTSIFGAITAITLVLSTFFVGLRIRLHSQAVIYGLFIYFSGKLLTEIPLLFHEPASWYGLQDFLKAIYIFCILAWSVVFWFDEPSRVFSLELDGVYKNIQALERARSSRHA